MKTILYGILPQCALTRIFLSIVVLLSFTFPAHASTEPYLSGHGINFATGNKYQQETDISLEGPLRLAFIRTYNSQSTENGMLGYGWSGSFSERLIDNTNAITLVQSDGRQVNCSDNGQGGYASQLGQVQIIVRVTGGFKLTRPNQDVHTYDSTGRLTGITFHNSTTLTYSYSGNQVTSITDSLGRTFIFTYTSNRLTGLATPGGAFTYGYDGNGNLNTVTRPDGKSRTYEYADSNDVHNLTGIFDASNVRIQTLTYDSSDRVVTSTLAGGADKITIGYPAQLSRTVTDALNIVSTYELDAQQGAAKMKSFTGPGCTTSCGDSTGSSYTYNSRQLLLSSTDGNGVMSTFTYDTNGNRLTKTEASGTTLARTTTMSYTAKNELASVTESSVNNPGQNKVTNLTYDDNGNLRTRTVQGYAGTTGISQATAFTSNSLGQITSIDGPRMDVNDIVQIAYYPNVGGQGNNRGQLQSVANALGQTTTYSDYTALGKPGTITDANGLATTITYALDGKVLTRTTGGLTNQYGYDDAGRLLTVTLSGARTISYSYSNDRVASITDSLGNTINYSYDAKGRQTGQQVSDPGHVVTYSLGLSYDQAGNLSKRTYADNAEEIYSYDPVRNLIQSINPLGTVTAYSYDNLRRLLSLTKAGVAVSRQGYDKLDNLTSVTDARNHVTTGSSDDLGNIRRVTAPDTGATNSTYDPAGNLITVTDAKGQITNFTYDALNRPISQGYAGTGDILFSYDQGAHAIGRLSQITDREGTDSFAYDAVGRIVTETRVIGNASHTIGYSWDSSTGDLAGMTYPSGLNLTYSRDANGQVSAIATNNTTVISAVAHLPFGPIKSATLGSVNLAKEFDQRYALTRISAATLNYAYTRDAGGRVTKITGIQSPTIDNASVGYNYNAANNQLTSATFAPPNTYTYDANGNMVLDGVFTFIYDGLNRLIRVEQQGNIVATYGYDSSNRRVRKTVGSITTHYLYDLNNRLIAETLADGTPLREYLYLDGEPIALKEYQTNPGLYYYINDHLGTPQQLVTANGTVVWKAAYLPYGLAQITTDTVKNNLRFPGQYFDAETGLHYNLNRYYDSDTGRYISADPLGLAGGMNLYAYVSGDPVNRVDPWGLRTCTGNARVLKGNANHIGLPGGLSSATNSININASSAAIIPSQWDGGKPTLRSNYNNISGNSNNGTLLFNNVADVVGGQSPDPTMNVRDWLMQNNPGNLIIELPGGQDLGRIPVTITVPDSMSCPSGTSEVTPQPCNSQNNN